MLIRPAVAAKFLSDTIEAFGGERPRLVAVMLDMGDRPMSLEVTAEAVLSLADDSVQFAMPGLVLTANRAGLLRAVRVWNPNNPGIYVERLFGGDQLSAGATIDAR